jgi:predicted ArsR family transcriptional regulator
MEGYTAGDVASWLQMPVTTARHCLTALQRKGYVLCSSLTQDNERGHKTCGWIIDYDHPSRNDDFLFWEFAYLC